MIQHSLKKTGGVPILWPGSPLISQSGGAKWVHQNYYKSVLPVPVCCLQTPQAGVRKITSKSCPPECCNICKPCQCVDVDSNASIGGENVSWTARSSLSSSRLSVINILHNILYVLLDINALNIYRHIMMDPHQPEPSITSRGVTWSYF